MWKRNGLNTNVCSYLFKRQFFGGMINAINVQEDRFYPFVSSISMFVCWVIGYRNKCGIARNHIKHGWMVRAKTVCQHSWVCTSSLRCWWALMQNKESQSTPIYPLCQVDASQGYFKASTLPHSADKSLH